MTLSIKNWSEFQHYQSGRGSPPWIKLYRSLLTDKEWFALPPDAAKTLVNLWMLAAESAGVLPDTETLAFRLRLDSKVIAKHLTQCNHWLIDDASNTLATCYQLASTETETETETEGEKSSSRTAKPKPAAKGSRLPMDWKLPKAWGDWAVSNKGLSADQVRAEADKFSDYWRAKPGKDAVKLDWQATWRNWIRNAADRIPGKDRQSPDSLFAGAL